jgi:hypothetical protein
VVLPEFFCEVINLIPKRIFYFPGPGRDRNPGKILPGTESPAVRRERMKQMQGIQHLLGEKVSQRECLFEFIGRKEFPIISRVGPKYKSPVKRKALPFPAGNTAFLFRNERPAATVTAPVISNFKAAETLMTETVPGFFRIEKHIAAYSAA